MPMNYRGLTLDPFQEQAFECVQQGRSVIVAAPTGCGKTLIADYAVEQSLEKKHKVVYTAPIKALSNQKYRDFRARFGAEMVGIHTGDVSMNPDAPLLIMTTEIFRNLILEHSPRLDNVHFAVFDEIHYLDDPERGTVWEESIILAPAHIQFICLSATVPNINDLAAWMQAVRGYPIRVIEENHRPVPLKHYLYSSKYGNITLKGIRKLYKRKASERKKFLHKRPDSNRIVSMVLELERFPILYFCFNRRACERNAERAAEHSLISPLEQEQIRAMVDMLEAQYQLEHYERLEQMRQLWEAGIAYHHAGMLPAAKEIVERLFATGLIKLLFCTETFALGINMPASTVILDELEKFDGVEFKYLMTRNYNQIAGRAGRRGMDEVGYVYSQVVPEAADPTEIERVLFGKNEIIRSRFYASYSTILNLYSHYGEKSFEIFARSLRNFQNGQFSQTRSYQKQEQQIRNRIAFLQANGFLEGTALTAKGRLAAAVNGYEIQAGELYYQQSFTNCTVEQIPVILGGLITEQSRRRGSAPALTAAQFRFDAEKTIRSLRRREVKFNIDTPIAELDLAYAAPIYAWTRGCSLAELLAFGIPEGDLIRVLRMVVQLIRSLRDRVPDPVVSEKMHQALERVNRGVVDAQAELNVQ